MRTQVPGSPRPISSGNKIALNFLPFREQNFTFVVYRRPLTETDQSVPGTRWLPIDCLAAPKGESERHRYAVSLTKMDGHEETSICAWVNPGLTVHVLYTALIGRASDADLVDYVEIPENQFRREVHFILKRHKDAREVMSLRPFELRATGHFGLLCRFSLQWPDDTALSEKTRLELSLTHKNGRTNEDFYLDHRDKIELFLGTYFDQIAQLKLHDFTTVHLDRRLSIVPSFVLERRIFVFGGGRESRNQFFGLRDYGPLEAPKRSSQLAFLFRKEDRERSQDLYRALRGDTYPTFPGMEKLFRLRVSRDNVVGTEVEDLTNAELRKAGKALSERYLGMTVIPLLVVPWSKHSSDQETNEYYAAKHALLSERLSSQFVDRKRLDDRNSFKWSVSNIGLGLFAKMGGIPWLVKPSTEKCLIVGIGQAHSIVNGITERYIAYSVLSDSTGLYEKIRVLGDTRNHKEYLNSLKANLKIVLTEHKGGFRSFVVHVTFSMRRDEIDTIVAMLRELDQEGEGHEFIAIKVNDHNDFFGFSVDHNSLVPFEGTVARLSNREYVMWFSGLSNTDAKVPKKPERPVHIRVLYPKTPLPEVDLKRILQDALNISGTNWRGFNAKSMPISVYYAKMIADFYRHFRELDLPDVDFESVTPWFL